MFPTPLRAVEHRHRGGVRLCVAETDEHNAAVSVFEQFEAFAMQHHVRFAAFFATHFEIMPAELRADASAERFRNGFLGGEARGEERRGNFVRETILDFVGQQNALEKSFAELFVRRRDASDFNDINANAEDHLVIQNDDSRWSNHEIHEIHESQTALSAAGHKPLSCLSCLSWFRNPGFFLLDKSHIEKYATAWSELSLPAMKNRL